MKKIRESDEKLLKCSENFKNEEPYYSIVKTGINTKIALENKNPEIVKILLGENYLGGKKSKIVKN